MHQIPQFINTHSEYLPFLNDKMLTWEESERLHKIIALERLGHETREKMESLVFSVHLRNLTGRRIRDRRLSAPIGSREAISDQVLICGYNLLKKRILKLYGSKTV